MRHADHGFLNTRCARFLQHVIEYRNDGVTAFTRKSLLAHVLGVQIALQALGCGQPLQDVALLLDGEARLQLRRLDAQTQPFALVLVGHVHVFNGDTAAIDGAQRRDDIFELGATLAIHWQQARRKLGLHIAVDEAVMLVIQLLDERHFLPL